MTNSRQTHSDLIAILRGLGLLSPDESPGMEALAGGVSSRIVRVDAARGTLCVKQALAKLRVASDWHAPVERSMAEAAWLKLAAQIIPGSVPDVLGEDRVAMAFAMEYLEPATHPVWKALLRDGVIEHEFSSAVAAQLVRMHGATSARPELAAQFAHREQFHALRLEPYFAATAFVHPDRKEPLHALINATQATNVALMHGDVSPKNILAGPRGPVFLDAECACWGDPAFDLAFCANHLLLKCVWHPQWTDRYIGSFHAMTRTYLDDVTWEPASQLESRACALLGGMLLARIDGRSPVEYITDERDKNMIREFARAQLISPDRTLAALAQRWRRAWDA